ncbi:MAG: TRAP transporter large permease subunit, partial [Pseudomonadota bacterium]|nr:TRAP transporter large permease subunit [Pseudomonadota bacterium]
WPLPLLILGVVGSIYAGVATPTEAGALGALFACVIGALKGAPDRATLTAAVSESLRTTASVFFLAIGAIFLTRFLAMAGIPGVIAEVVTDLDLGPLELVLLMSAVYLVLGMFLDPIGVMLLTLPVLLPAFNALGMDLIWLGVIVVKLIEIGLLTPPVGLNVYVVKGVVGDQVPLGAIFRGVGWFLACEFVIMVLLIAFPALSLWLPGLMEG